MTPARRQQLLQALEIERWVPRSRVAAAPAPVALAAVAPAIALLQPQPQPEVPAVPAVPAARTRSRGAPVPAPPAPELPALEPLVLPDEWPGLQALVSQCQRCKLCQTRTQTVFGVGVTQAPLMIVGEGPGADEDAQGEPFVGRAGKLLDEMLKAIGYSRQDNAYIANVVKCRPPGNRDPEPDEVEACRPYLDQQIRLLRPRLIVGLGRIAAQRLLQTDAPLSRLRGPMYEYGPEKTPLFITYHPAYLLRSPREKAKSWEDLKKIHRFLRSGA